MALRNFWLETKIDGRKTVLTGGPKNKKGGMRTKIYVRDRGTSIVACSIDCTERDGNLIINIYNNDGQCIYSDITKR